MKIVKIIVLVLIFKCSIKGDGFAQYPQYSKMIDAALNLYYRLPSGTLLSKHSDSLIGALNLKRVTQNGFKGDSLQISNSMIYDKAGFVESVISKGKLENGSFDSTRLDISRIGLRSLDFVFTFSLDAIRDTMDFGFSEIIDTLQLNEKRHCFKASFELLDSNTANVLVVVNDKFSDRRQKVVLYPFLFPGSNEFEADKSFTKWDSVIQNENLVSSKIDTLNDGKLAMTKNCYSLTSGQVLKHEYFQATNQGEWQLKHYIIFCYDDSGRFYKKTWKKFHGDSLEVIDSLTFYTNGAKRTSTKMKILPMYFLSDSLFSQDGKLLFVRSYDMNLLLLHEKQQMSHFDEFFRYNSFGLLVEEVRYIDGILMYRNEIDYEFWSK